jgi:hypothetical protein
MKDHHLLADRLASFHEMAAEAKAAALHAKSPEDRRSFEELAASFVQLIQEIEAAKGDDA